MGGGGFRSGRFCKAFLAMGVFAPVLGAAGQTPEPQTSTITVQSNLVLVPTLVQDAKGGVLYGLKASQFVVKDNGIVQTVHVEDAAEASALSLVVLVQCSRSAEEQGENLRGSRYRVARVVALVAYREAFPAANIGDHSGGVFLYGVLGLEIPV